MTPPLRRSCVAALAFYANPFAFTLARLPHTGAGTNQYALSGRGCHISRSAHLKSLANLSPVPELVCRSFASYQSTACFLTLYTSASLSHAERSWTTNTTAEILTTQNKNIQADAVRYYLDRRTLEAHLISLLDAAHLEQARGVLAGAPVFAVLSRQASEQVRIHCNHWQLDPRRVEAEIPSIAELRRLTVRAVPEGRAHGGGWLLTIGLAVLAISVALTSD